RPGEKKWVSLGGKGTRLDPGPVELEVTLLRRSSGDFDLEDRQSHLASMKGMQIEMGPCAVVRYRGVTLLLTSRKTPPFDLGQWHSQGIDPARLDVINVKAAVGHRRAYDPIARASYTVETPGPCSSNLTTLPFRRLRRPIFPLDSNLSSP
ncbi:MAG TPA: MlrC C-terminal domain-containing protein, partial [Candidatus Methylacidiphilales bacterium]